MAKIKPFLSHSIKLYADSWKDYEFFNHYSNQKHLTTVCASEKKSKNFVSGAANFLEKTV